MDEHSFTNDGSIIRSLTNTANNPLVGYGGDNMRVLFGACILLRFQDVIRILVEKTTLIVLNSHSTLYFTRSHNRTIDHITRHAQFLSWTPPTQSSPDPWPAHHLWECLNTRSQIIILQTMTARRIDVPQACYFFVFHVLQIICLTYLKSTGSPYGINNHAHGMK